MIASPVQAGSSDVQTVSLDLDVEHLNQLIAMFRDEFEQMDVPEDSGLTWKPTSRWWRHSSQRPSPTGTSSSLLCKGILATLATVGATGKGIDYLNQLIHLLSPYVH
jgi:hypothetical protein